MFDLSYFFLMVILLVILVFLFVYVIIRNQIQFYKDRIREYEKLKEELILIKGEMSEIMNQVEVSKFL